MLRIETLDLEINHESILKRSNILLFMPIAGFFKKELEVALPILFL